MSSQRKRIVIVGSGVAGSILAYGLRNIADAEVICLERASADDHSDAGTGLNVGPNAIKALRHFLPDLADLLVSSSLPWSNWRISLTDGRELMNLPLTQVADNDGIRIRWSQLYALLRQPVLDRVRFGVEVTAMRYARAGEAGPIVVETVDRQTGAEGRIDGVDLLVGGDGRYSRVRETFLGKPQPYFLGVCIFRLLIEQSRPDLVDDYEQWFNGPNRLLAFRVPGNGTYIAGSFPILPDQDVPLEARRAEVLRALYTPQDAVPSDQCAFLIDAICNNLSEIHWARLQEATPVFSDPGRRILLLGDAAHPMVPTLGQGATQAIEDACVAVSMLGTALGDGGHALGDALEAIEQRRRARVEFVVDFSRDATDTMLAGADPVAGSLAKTRPDFQAKLAKLYRDIPAA
ncbi:NAD(P)/FAD-dependent oxidoreductase [Ferrovibrio sp.]|uniref:FAD-dependent oxidoreductase n=1 Tax=Ferrovibrio sp. TaxID=1917215 RepID=UPI00260D8FFC|nr:NAD(P)/FAD-dependent oxidoreductase [Ferrovibrio sp.]